MLASTIDPSPGGIEKDERKSSQKVFPSSIYINIDILSHTPMRLDKVVKESSQMLENLYLKTSERRTKTQSGESAFIKRKYTVIILIVDPLIFVRGQDTPI